jgi:zinc transport system substrate-binding protein
MPRVPRRHEAPEPNLWRLRSMRSPASFCAVLKIGIVPIPERGDVRKRRRPLAFPVAVAVALALIAGACGRSGPPAASGRVTVVASFYPLAEAAMKVGGDRVDVINLTPPGVEPHDLELTPDRIAQIQEADVVLYLGGGFAPAVEQAVADARGSTVDLLAGIGHPGDPHVWLDPVRYRTMVDRTERALAKASPQDAERFAADAQAFEAQLADLDREYRAGLARCARRVIVTSHEAFGYLAERYGLVQQAIAGLAPDVEPTPDRLAELAALVRDEGVTTIFTEELVSPKVAETLAREAGVKTAVLNPLEGLTDQEVAAGADYITVMRQNLRTLQAALGCRPV